MPVIKKAIPLKGRAKLVAKRKAALEEAPFDDDVSLPTVPSKPMQNFNDYTTLIFGDPSIGKTSLVSMMAGKTLFLMTEPGGKGLSLYQKPCRDWRTFKQYLSLLEGEGGAMYSAVCVDVIDLLYNQCFEWTCAQLGIAHPMDENDFGKSWSEISKEFSKGIQRLMALGKGVYLLAHAKLRKIEKRDGSSFDTLVPNVSGQPYAVLEGLVDHMFYYGYHGDERVLVLRGDEFIATKMRTEQFFLTPKGRKLRSINMGGSKQEAHAALIKGFNNKIVTVGELPYVKPKIKTKG